MSEDEFGTDMKNVFDKKSDTYIETLVVYGKMVNVFISDYGQCYWFQWVDENGNLASQTCGTYNSEYRNEIECFFRPRIDVLEESVKNLRIELREMKKEISRIKKDTGKVN